MGKIFLNPECWNCGNTIRNDKICPKCGEHLEDAPTIQEEDNPIDYLEVSMTDSKTGIL
jgi:predicted amidophosphoribosyltransferase